MLKLFVIKQQQCTMHCLMCLKMPTIQEQGPKQLDWRTTKKNSISGNLSHLVRFIVSNEYDQQIDAIERHAI